MSWRKIDVDGLHWEYRFGVSNAVIKHFNIKFVVDYSELTGRSWDTLERGQYKKTQDGMVTPKHIRAYLMKHRNNWKHLIK